VFDTNKQTMQRSNAPLATPPYPVFGTNVPSNVVNAAMQQQIPAGATRPPAPQSSLSGVTYPGFSAQPRMQQLHQISQAELTAASNAASSVPPVTPPNVNARYISGDDTRNIPLDEKTPKLNVPAPYKKLSVAVPVYNSIGWQQVQKYAGPRGVPTRNEQKLQVLETAAEAAARVAWEKAKDLPKEKLLQMMRTDPVTAQRVLAQRVFREQRANQEAEAIRFIRGNPLVKPPGSDMRSKIDARIFRPRSVHVDSEEQKFKRGAVQADSRPMNARLRN
jgi:hypothetical protein